jgi:hypothetical protein
MADLNESFKEFSKIQADLLKPMREANGIAVDAIENYARLSYATTGDLMNYAIEQTQLASNSEDFTGLISKQYEKVKELNEKMTSRFNESVELTKDFFSSMQKIEVAPIFEAPAKAAKKATTA